MAKSDEEFRHALSGRKLPPLTLDHQWHQLVVSIGAEKKIHTLSAEQTELLKQQAGAANELKKLKKLKKRLMDEIVTLAETGCDGTDKKAEKKLDEHKALIEECNRKIDECEHLLISLPGELDEVNRKLMQMTMEMSYDLLKKNGQEIETLTEWIDSTREELKEKLVRRQEMQGTSQNIYTYMHNVFGPEVVDIFDLQNFKPVIKEQEEKKS